MTILARARIVLSGDTVALTRSLAGAEAAMKQAGQRMSAIGRNLSTKVTLPLLAVGVGSIKAFADFDDAMIQSQAIMTDLTDTLRNEMVVAAKEVARATTTSSKAAAESFFFLASAGLTAEQSIAALPQVARFAQAGMFGMALATDLATDAQSALGLTVDDARQNLVNLTRVTDVLVKANTLANATVLQFSESLTREAGAALKTFNIDIEEGVAVLAAFADQGVKGQVAGSGLSRILRLMTAAAVNNKKEMKLLGIEVFDADKNIRNLADIIEDLEEGLGSMADAERVAALESIGFTARVQGIILPLLGTSQAIREYEEGLRGAAGITKEIADKQLQSFSAQLKLTWNQIVLAANAAGEVMAPAIRGLSNIIRSATKTFEEFSPRIRTAIVVVLGLTAAVGPLLIVLGGLATAISFVTFAPLIAGFAALAPFLLPGAVILIGLGLLAAAFIKTKTASREAAAAIVKSTNDLMATFATFTPEAAVKRVERFDEEIERLRQRFKLLRDNVNFLATDSSKLAVALAEEETGIIGGRDAMIEQANTLRNLIIEKKGFRDVLLEVIESAKNEKGVTDALAESLTTLSKASLELKDSLRQADVLDELLESFDLTAAKAEAYKTAIAGLVEEGASLTAQVGPQGETLAELVAIYEALVKEIDAATKGQTALDEALTAVQVVIKQVSTPLEIYTATLKRLEELKPFLTQEQFARAVKQAGETMDDAAAKGRDWGDSMQQVASRALDSFLRFTTQGTASFSDFADSVMSDLLRIARQIAISALFKSLNLAPVGGFRHGGFVVPGRMAVVGEAGPELVQAGRGGLTVQPLRNMGASSLGGGGEVAPQVSVTIQAVDARSFAELLEQNPAAITAPLLQAFSRSALLRGELLR